MTVQILISVDLRNAEPWQKRLFLKQMVRRQWLRMPRSETAYFAEFSGVNSDADVLSHVESELSDVARSVQLDDWDSVCCLSS